jgi:hypothetical protein
MVKVTGKIGVRYWWGVLDHPYLTPVSDLGNRDQGNGKIGVKVLVY